MAGYYPSSPATAYADNTLPSQAHTLGFSPEKTFVSPSKGQPDLLAQIRGGHVPALTTPSARHQLANNARRPNARAEFTPLLKSAARNRMQRALDEPGYYPNGKLKTPRGLRGGKGASSPALPEPSLMYAEDVESSAYGEGEGTPMPPAISSSAVSTPMALPRGDGGFGAEGGNVLTLREQEAVSLFLLLSILVTT